MMSRYISLSKNDFYSFVVVFPLFILYQLLGFLNNYNSSVMIKNSADVYIKNFFDIFGPNYSSSVYSIFLFLFLVIVFIKNRKLFISYEIKIVFLFGIIIESVIHSVSLLVFMSMISELLPLSITFFQSTIMENIYLSIGAGIWEEVLFRYIMISGLFFLFNKIMIDFSIYSYFIIICFSSALFSYYHFLGLDPFTVNLSIFIYRFLAGVALSIIFIFRGLGVTVYTHTFYDLYLSLFR